MYYWFRSIRRTMVWHALLGVLAMFFVLLILTLDAYGYYCLTLNSSYAYCQAVKHQDKQQDEQQNVTNAVSETNPPSSETKPVDTPSAAVALPSSSTESAKPKKKVVESPPIQQPVPNNDIKGETIQNNDGSTTTVVSEGNVTMTQVNQVAALQTTPDTPLAVRFNDETGKYSSLEQPLKEYLNGILKWGNEINSLREIDIVEAGESGWSGQYAGSYTAQSNGDITSAFGWITLNVSYYESSLELVDYMKLVLAHEYGHHYTLYHKWVDADLPAGTRFPDSYYNVRPLSKSQTAVDYSLGWDNCEVEIIAEDYAYLYSGYRYHAMQSTLGLPSDPGTKNWLDDIVASLKRGVVANQPPTVEIVVPANSAEVTGEVVARASASDDRQVTGVDFYLGSTKLSHDTQAPYEVSVNTLGYANGDYTLKAIAIDSDGVSTEKAIAIKINNPLPEPVPAPTSPPVTVDTELPVISFVKPASPYEWTSGNLKMEIRSTDNISVTKVEIYLNGDLNVSLEESNFTLSWKYSDGDPGDYTVTAKAYDAAGNIGESEIVVHKQ